MLLACRIWASHLTVRHVEHSDDMPSMAPITCIYRITVSIHAVLSQTQTTRQRLQIAPSLSSFCRHGHACSRLLLPCLRIRTNVPVFCVLLPVRGRLCQWLRRALAACAHLSQSSDRLPLLSEQAAGIVIWWSVFAEMRKCIFRKKTDHQTSHRCFQNQTATLTSTS